MTQAINIYLCKRCGKDLTPAQADLISKLVVMSVSENSLVYWYEEIKPSMKRTVRALEKKGFLITQEAPSLYMKITCIWDDEEDEHSKLICACRLPQIEASQSVE